MECNKSGLLKVLGDGTVHFSVPVYLRDHSWREPQCQQRIGDLSDLVRGERGRASSGVSRSP